MVTATCAIGLDPGLGSVDMAEHGTDRRARTLEAAGDLAIGMLERASAGEHPVELHGEPRPIVLHHGELLGEIGAQSIGICPPLSSGIEQIKRGGKAADRTLETIGQAHESILHPAAISVKAGTAVN
jgi:hypothetical protein